jgi:GntR family transcriptional regulator
VQVYTNTGGAGPPATRRSGPGGKEAPNSMLFTVDPHSGVPIFRQLMEQVKRSIATGALASGDEMPSVRQLSVPLGVNPMTISKAYNLLVHEGVLERRPGLPLVVARVSSRTAAVRRRDELKAVLRPAVVLARQLDVGPDEAAETLRRLFDDTADELRGSQDEGEDS